MKVGPKYKMLADRKKTNNQTQHVWFVRPDWHPEIQILHFISWGIQYTLTPDSIHSSTQTYKHNFDSNSVIKLFFYSISNLRFSAKNKTTKLCLLTGFCLLYLLITKHQETLYLWASQVNLLSPWKNETVGRFRSSSDTFTLMNYSIMKRVVLREILSALAHGHHWMHQNREPTGALGAYYDILFLDEIHECDVFI